MSERIDAARSAARSAHRLLRSSVASAGRAVRLLVGIEAPPRVDEREPFAPWLAPKPGHPSELCRCACGPGAPRGEHEVECEWWRWMCDDCGGSGICKRCGGDGTRAARLATGAEFLAEFDALGLSFDEDAFAEREQDRAEDRWNEDAPEHLARVRAALVDAIDSGICAPPIHDWRMWALDLWRSIPERPSPAPDPRPTRTHPTSPPLEPAARAHDDGLAVGDDEREVEGGPGGDEVG